MIEIENNIENIIKKNSDKDAFYVYDLNVMDRQMDLLSCLPDNVKTFYAMKVNPHPEVIANALKHKNIEGIEVASIGEISNVEFANKVILENKNYVDDDLSRIIYTGPSKKSNELWHSVSNDIRYLNIESFREALRINEIAKILRKVQPVLMRLNTKHKFNDGEAGVTLGSGDTQFGFAQNSAKENLNLLSKLDNIRVDGFHMYPATGVMDANVLLGSVRSTFDFLKEIQKETNREYSVMDFGGGFGIDYSGNKVFNIETYGAGLENLISDYGFEDKDLYLELGRFLGADMGYFVTKVNDIKTLGSGVKAVLCNAGTNAHKRPQVLNVDYKLGHVKISDSYVNVVFPTLMEKLIKLEDNFIEKYDLDMVKKGDKFNVYGPFCTSVDVIAKNKISDSDIDVGDFLVQPQAGAYGKSMSPQDFLSHPKVVEIFIK